jgi:membrane protease YdiL (CAAX protease family)
MNVVTAPGSPGDRVDSPVVARDGIAVAFRALDPADVRVLWFFGLAYALSWALWFPAVAARVGWIGEVSSRELHLVGALGPMVAAFVVTARAGGRAALVRLARRCVTGHLWIVIAILIPAGLFLVAAAILAVFSDVAIAWGNVGRSMEFPELPRPVYWMANVIFYGFGEEVGWRGFALPRLQSRASAFRASLLLGVGWAGWHAPLFIFSPGLANLGLGGAIGWLASLVLGSILLTWLFNSSGGSIAAVALFHAALDIFFVSPVAAELPNVMGALLTVGTLLLIPILGRQNLARSPRVVEPPTG